MNIILFDGELHTSLLPLTYTKPVGLLRIGILTIKEKWERRFGVDVSYITQSYLAKKYPLALGLDNLYVKAGLLPTDEIVELAKSLENNQGLKDESGKWIVVRTQEKFNEVNDDQFDQLGVKNVLVLNEANVVVHPWDIFKMNGIEIENDFNFITQNRVGEALNATNTVLGNAIFIEKGAKVNCAILNAETGPIYIGKDAEIMEGTVIRGPFALLNNASVKLAAKIYGPTTIGPHSKVGGEVNNSVIQGYSNKGHDGFLGNSVIGEWCNLGADTNNSNLKNNYSNIKVWNYIKEDYIDTKLQFCGLIMGDHSKSGINTMFNTGTVVGVSANVFGAGFPKKFIPSYTWGGAENIDEYDYKKSIDVAKRVCERRNVEVTIQDEEILEYVFKISKNFRLGHQKK